MDDMRRACPLVPGWGGERAQLVPLGQVDVARRDPLAYQFGGAGRALVIRARAGTWIRSRVWRGRPAGITDWPGTVVPLRDTMRSRAGAVGAIAARRGPGTTTRSGTGTRPAGSTCRRPLTGTRSRTRTWPGRTRTRTTR